MFAPQNQAPARIASAPNCDGCGRGGANGAGANDAPWCTIGREQRSLIIIVSSWHVFADFQRDQATKARAFSDDPLHSPNFRNRVQDSGAGAPSPFHHEVGKEADDWMPFCWTSAFSPRRISRLAVLIPVEAVGFASSSQKPAHRAYCTLIELARRTPLPGPRLSHNPTHSLRPPPLSLSTITLPCHAMLSSPFALVVLASAGHAIPCRHVDRC